jgi:hypothetical protein
MATATQLFDQHIERRFEARDKSFTESDYKFNWSDEEKAIDLALMTLEFEQHGLDKRLFDSKRGRVNAGCKECGAHCFPEEITSTNHHIGCGGVVESFPF